MTVGLPPLQVAAPRPESSVTSDVSAESQGRGVGRLWRGRRKGRRDRTPRRYLVGVSLVLTGAALAQRPGKIVADTKVALAIDPGHFLGNALHLWNAGADSGSVGDQSTGYLVPMGPFFLLTHALGIPTAIAQRLWLGLLLIVGFWGLVRLGDALGIGNRPGRILGGLAYALSPFVLSRIGDNSALLLGGVMLPWVLLPLVRATTPRDGDTDGPPVSARRAAAASGCAVLLMGGVNASVTLDALIPPVLWLALMCRGRRAWILRAWWAGAVVCAVAWWVVALRLQGRYGIDFVRYTESASTTTSVTSLPETIRGTADWLGYLRLNTTQLSSAWTYIGAPAAVVASYVLAALGLAGLCRSRVPARRFMLACLGVGVVAVAAAYAGDPHGVLSTEWRHALGGPLAALRNINKFQPLIRLPLALGLAHCLPLLAVRSARKLSWRRATNLASGLVVAAAVTVGAATLGLGRVYPSSSFAAVPSYWQDAASWLDRHATNSRTLLLPGSGFGDYRWGDPADEPLLWLAHTTWAVRNVIPLGGVNSTRLLDAIEQQLAQRAAPDLAATLARSGVGYVVVRNDLAAQAGDEPPASDQIQAALTHGGLHRVTSFGPLLAGRLSGRQVFFHVHPPAARVPALEVWATPGAHQVDAYPAHELAVLSGGPEAIPAIQAAGVLGQTPTVLAADVAGGKAAVPLPAGLHPSGWIDTDTLARRDEQFGTLHGGTSYLLADGAKAAGENSGPQMRLDLEPQGHQTVARYGGISAVTASHYGTLLGAFPLAGPQSAVDGDLGTAWSVSGFPNHNVGQWLQVSFPTARSVPFVIVQMLADSPKRPHVTSLRVTTAGGSAVTRIRDTEKLQRIAVPSGSTKTLRLTIAGVAGRGSLFVGPGVRELNIPGVVIQQEVVLPADAATLFAAGRAAPNLSYVFSRDRTDPRAFLDLDPERQIARVFTVPRTASFFVAGTAVARIGAATLAGPAAGTVTLPCGSGPTVRIDSTNYATYLRGSRAAYAAGQPIALGLCVLRPVQLAPGSHTLRTLPSAKGDPAIGVANLWLTSRGTPAQPSARTATPRTWSSERREVRLPAGDATILTIHENFNRSWHATADGKRVAALRVDGWQQGFLVPAGAAVTVKLVNSPGIAFHQQLIAAAVLVLALLLAAALPAYRRRRPILAARAHGTLITRLAALIAAAAVTSLVAGPLVAAVIPVLAIAVWFIRRAAPVMALAAIAVAGGVALTSPERYPVSHQGAFSPIAQVAVALALDVALLSAGSRRTGQPAASERASLTVDAQSPPAPDSEPSGTEER